MPAALVPSPKLGFHDDEAELAANSAGGIKNGVWRFRHYNTKEAVVAAGCRGVSCGSERNQTAAIPLPEDGARSLARNPHP